MVDPPEVALAAGQLSVLYTQGALRYIRYAGVEVLRHIYFAVRDRDWRTIPGRIVRQDIRVDTASFEITFDAEHAEGDIVFRWTGQIRGSAARVEFSAAGSAGSRFFKNRIGLCVLHPGSACAGQPVRLTHTDGSVEHSRFPLLVSPAQPFVDVCCLQHQPGPGLDATVTLEGETFETEDQRNWTDGSFKTYSTPLSLPFPVEVQEGWPVRHRVVCEVSELVTVAPLRDRRFAWPALGTGASHGEADLKAWGLQHVRVDCHDGDTKPVLNAARFGVPLEVAIHSASLEQLASIRDAAMATGTDIARWIVYNVPAHEARRILPGDVGSGTDANFAELNRRRHLLDGFDFAAFSINPQVHGSDERTIAETLEGQADAVGSLRAFANRVVISPLTLLPRFNAVATSNTEPAAGPPADPRQSSPFIAAWTLGSLASLSAAGASSITLFEAAGPRGIAGTPVAALLSAIAEFAPEYAYPCEVSCPLSVAALGLGRTGAESVLVANLQGQPVEITLPDNKTLARLGPYEIQWIEN